MKKTCLCFRWILVVVIMLFTVATHAQNSDSLLRIMGSSHDAQVRIEAAQTYLTPYQFKSVDSIRYAADQLIRIGKEQNFLDLEAVGTAYYGLMHRVKGQMYEALSSYIKALTLAEKAPNNLLFSLIYTGYGNLYGDANPDKSLGYYKKALSYLEAENSLVAAYQKMGLLNNIGLRFNDKKLHDSALVYLQKSVEIAVLSKGSLTNNSANANLGNAYLGLGQLDLAYTYYRRYFDQAIKLQRERSIRGAEVLLGKYYKTVGNNDSAIAYYRRALVDSSITSDPSWAVDPSLALYEIYRGRGNDKEALLYLELHRNAKLKADSVAQVQQLQSLSFEEDMRQLERDKELLKEKEDRKHNLQYAAIALGMVALLIGFLVLSHSVLANQKLIRFLGVVSLLIVFEFLNLLLHPWLGKITHESPVLMLLIMVALAAGLVPLHHRLEHWITHKLVEKNNKIRLAAARKTIAKLEGKTDTSSV